MPLFNYGHKSTEKNEKQLCNGTNRAAAKEVPGNMDKECEEYCVFSLKSVLAQIWARCHHLLSF